MAASTSPSISFPTPGPDRLTSKAATPEAERATLAELAAQFESTLMLEMIKQMRKALLDEQAEGEGLGNETYSATIDQELALHLSRAGGLGLTSAMVDSWDRQQRAIPAGSAVGPAELAPLPARRQVDVTPAVGAAPVSVVRHDHHELKAVTGGADDPLSLEMPGRVSSSYGWRTDPFKGQAKFHGGIDLAARYGTEVPAAAAGTVVTAGEQGGYGLTVVVRHPNGFESRYAHLSSIAVRPGESIGRGEQVGRVGSTGRSTGPHLHFEVTQAGQRVDPEQFVRNLTSDTKGQ